MSTGDHYNSEVAESEKFDRKTLKEDKAQVSAQNAEAPTGEEKISYGKKFSQTEELYAARLMNRELEELARQDGMLDDEESVDESAESNVEAKRKAKSASRSAPASMNGRMATASTPLESEKPADMKVARPEQAQEAARRMPIGALPTAAEPMPKDRFSDVLDDASRYLGMMRHGVQDITTAAFRLARLPVELAILAANRFNPLKA